MGSLPQPSHSTPSCTSLEEDVERERGWELEASATARGMLREPEAAFLPPCLELRCERDRDRRSEASRPDALTDGLTSKPDAQCESRSGKPQLIGVLVTLLSEGTNGRAGPSCERQRSRKAARMP
mmetsp:Transcript_45025/g.104160  ORF Transcript_45025/g.104160 Transcript_45025/m.104160 type:complete len:125 (+) Transcript_45025:1267-1641(+)